MAPSSRPQWVQNAVGYAIDNIWDLLAIAVAAYLLIRHQFRPYGASDIGMLATWIIALLGLIAVSGLWQQHRRLKAMETLERETHDLVAHKLVGPPRAQEFFWPADRTVAPGELAQANDICIVGMTLIRAMRTHMAVLGERLAAGASVRIVVLDWKNEALMDIMPNRSIGSREKGWWRECIQQTQGLIEDIPLAGQVKGTLKIGFLPYFPSFGMTLIDPDRPHGRIHVEIYHHRTAEPNAAFSLQAGDDAYWYRFFRSQFEVLWRSCEEKGRVVEVAPGKA